MREFDYTPEQLQKLHRILDEFGAKLCPICGRVLDFGDISWNNASTEYGTP